MCTRSQGLRGLIEQEICAITPQFGKARNNFLSFIQYVRAYSGLLEPGRFQRTGSGDSLKRLMRGLLRMSLNRGHWVRSIETWICESQSQHEQVNSLLQHLFAKYPVPRFLNHVWFDTDAGDIWASRTRKSSPGISVYLSLGKGASVRQCGLPVGLSKSGAHEFSNAPDDLTIWQAIRWAQIRSAGGSQWLARTILETRLSHRQSDELFWQEVIEFFIRAEKTASPTLTESDVLSIVQFVREQKFEPASRVLNYRCIGNDQPLQPDFRIRKRDLLWMRRHQVNWMGEIELPMRSSKDRNRKLGVWPSIGLDAYHGKLNSETWVIKELMSAAELEVEGGIMKHCVGGYDVYCLRNQASIWSMRVLRGDVWKRIATIEVCPVRRRVVQVQGKANSCPPDAAMEILGRWVCLENLTSDVAA